MKYFKLPDLGEGLPEAEIVEWHIKIGDTVKTDQVIVSVETAKAIVEVPSPQDGKIVALFGKEGEIIQTGEPLVEYESDVTEDAGTVVGKMEVATTASQEEQFFIGHPDKSTSTEPARTGMATNPSVKATPAIRHLAAKLNIDLAQVQGTGPNSSITADDLEKAKQSEGEQEGVEPLRGVRRTMAKTMAKAHAEVVQVTLFDEADISQWSKSTDPTIRMIRAIGVACQAEPGLNAWFYGNTLSRKLLDHVDLGVAVDTPEGLFVPVLRDITNRNGKALRAGLNSMREDVKARTIPPKELQGATITLSNFGTIAGKFASPIVVPPQVAIIGSGVIRRQPVAENDKVVIHPILPVSLSFDHRPITGGEAARFLKALIQDLEKKK